jgi:hypothetical protein
MIVNVRGPAYADHKGPAITSHSLLPCTSSAGQSTRPDGIASYRVHGSTVDVVDEDRGHSLAGGNAIAVDARPSTVCVGPI